MTTYQYINPENTVVAVFDDDGISRSSCLASILPEDTEIAAYVAPPTPIPTVISMRQARLALLARGKLDDVEAAINAQEEPLKSVVRIEWDYATEVDRNWPTLIALAPALGLTEADLDALFVEGSAL